MFALRSAFAALVLILAGLGNLVLASTAPELKPDHPQNYTVKQGDTLWGISQRFLSDPWRWQELWRGNPQVRDPNLLYPGDQLYLTYKNGAPVIRLSRDGRPVVKLSPRVRFARQGQGSIPVIPIDAINQFLLRPKVVDANELEDAPYVVSLGKEHIVAGSGSTVYARGGDPMESVRYTVFRQGDAYLDPEAQGDESILGYEATHIGDASMIRAGDPATLTLTSTKREVLVGDRLLPAEGLAVAQNFMPHAPEAPVNGSIISVVEGVTQIGRHQVVVLNRGREHGLDVGSVLAVWQRGEVIEDERALDPNAKLPEPDAETELDWDRQRGLDGFTMMLDRLFRDTGDAFALPDNSHKQVQLPEERAGTVLVFRTFENLSYALVMDASRAMHLSDTVTNP
jgi:hypothetical protein